MNWEGRTRQPPAIPTLVVVQYAKPTNASLQKCPLFSNYLKANTKQRNDVKKSMKLCKFADK